MTAYTDGKGPAGKISVAEIRDWDEKVAFDIMFAAVFGSEIVPAQGSLEPVLQEFRDAFAFSSSSRARENTALEIILPSDLLFALPFGETGKTKTSMSAVRSCFQDHIKHRKTKHAQDSHEQSDKTLLGTAMKTGSLSDEDLLEVCTTFVAAGYKIISAAVTWAIYFLSTRPDVQDVLRAEVRANLASPDNTNEPLVSADKLRQLSMLTAICNETLRLAPVVHLTYREALTETLLAGSGKVIPAGTILAISPWAIHRSPRYWRGGDPSEKCSSASHMTFSDPVTFDPTRWLFDKDGGARMQYSSIPFGRGPRSCIAEKFAQDEMSILLAILVGRYNFNFKSSGHDQNPDPEALRVSFDLIAKPVKLMVQMQQVEGW